MADDKVTNLALIRPRPRIELRDLALAAYYPRTQSPTPQPAIAPDVQSLQKRQRAYPTPPENIAKPWKKPWDK
jgi:hypothetical protein